MKCKHLFLLFVLLMVEIGCTHPINIKPMDFEAIKSSRNIGGLCAICISEKELHSKVVEGVSDKYAYMPYEDFKYGFTVALRSLCGRVGYYKTKQEASTNGSALIFVPKIQTKSNNGFWFWPPEKFTFTLNTDIFNSDGELVQHIQSTGTSTAGHSEWRENWGYAGSKAMEQALNEFFGKLDYNKFLNQTVTIKGKNE